MELSLNEKSVYVQEGIIKWKVKGLPHRIYAPTLKAPEARLLAAIAAEHDCPLLITDTRQAFLYGDSDMQVDVKVNIRPPSPDW